MVELGRSGGEAALHVASWGAEWAAPLPSVKAAGSSRMEYFLTGCSAVQKGPGRWSCSDSAAVVLCILSISGVHGRLASVP